MSENTERDELARALRNLERRHTALTRTPKHYRLVADDLTAAGYRRPWTITTVVELDALPIGSIVAMIGSEPDAPAVACRAVLGWQFLGGDPDRRYQSSALMPSPEPITVLYTPKASL